MAFLDTSKVDLKAENSDLVVEILGEKFPATIHTRCIYDPAGNLFFVISEILVGLPLSAVGKVFGPDP